MAGNRKVTVVCCNAFLGKRTHTQGNTHTDGQTLYLFGNAIAEWRDNEVWITSAGWNGPTTRERLSGLNCDVHTVKGEMYLNGVQWDGGWTKVQ